MDRRAFTLTAVALSLGLAASASAQTGEISFGIISTESSQNLKQAWQPLLEDMSRRTGLKINAFFAPDYAGIIEGMRFNKVHLAWMGNKSAMEAVDRSGAEVFAQTVSVDGSMGYYSLLVTHKDSPLNSLEDVIRQRQGLTLGFGDPNSTSGTLVPGYYAFQQHKVDPLKDFKRVVRANHETNLLAAASRQVDVATNNNEAIERLNLTNPAKAKDIKVIWKSPLIPSDPLVWRADLDPAVKARLREFLLGYGKQDGREQAILKVIGFAGFKASSNAQLLPIRQLELARERNRVENDSSLSAEDKQKKLQEIDARLAELQKLVASAR
ncbi:MAG: phosphonate ABC transporter substrate-binding protein [Pseudomonadota bacterium]